MNKAEVISQGYLEAYLTEDLNQADSSEVETLLSDPDVTKEYLKIQHLLENLSFQYAKEPSPVLKRLILNEVSKDMDSSTRVRNNGLKLMMAASIVMVLSSMFLAFHFWNKWRNTDVELSSLMAKNMMMAEQLNRVNDELGTVQNNLAILVSPEFSRIIMNGTENAPDAKAVIYWNSGKEKVFLHASALATLSQNQQYQLWALVDGKPVDAGVFDVTNNTFIQMKDIGKADAFAVTVEKRGGSLAPTLSTLQVYVNI